MNGMNAFLFWCAGTSISVIAQCKEPEQKKQLMFGAFVATTSVIALLTSYYFAYKITGEFSVSMIIAAIWCSLILNLDRYIIATMLPKATQYYRAKNKTNNEESNEKEDTSLMDETLSPLTPYTFSIKQIALRMLLAASIGVFVSIPIELYIFKKEISDQLNTDATTKEATLFKDKTADLISDRDTQKANIANRKQTYIDGRCATIQDAISDTATRIKQYKLAQENTTSNRDKTGEGCGPVCDGYKILEDKEKASLIALESRMGTCKKNSAIDFEQTAEHISYNTQTNQISHELITAKKEAKDFYANYAKESTPLMEYEALMRMASGNDYIKYAVFMTTLLFILFEIIPVLSKFWSGPGQYDLKLYAMRSRSYSEAIKEDSILRAVAHNASEIDTAIQQSAKQTSEAIHNANARAMEYIASSLQTATKKWADALGRDFDPGDTSKEHALRVQEAITAMLNRILNSFHDNKNDPATANKQSQAPIYTSFTKHIKTAYSALISLFEKASAAASKTKEAAATINKTLAYVTFGLAILWTTHMSITDNTSETFVMIQTLIQTAIATIWVSYANKRLAQLSDTHETAASPES